MLVALWIFFILLNGKLNLEIALTGFVVACLGVGVSFLFLDYSPKKEIAIYKMLPKLIRYLLILFKEIFLANLAVVRRVYSAKPVEPAIVTIPRKSKAEWKTVLEANSITLTPGTITMRLSEDSLTVHCLDADFGEGLEGSVFETELARMGGDEA